MISFVLLSWVLAFNFLPGLSLHSAGQVGGLDAEGTTDLLDVVNSQSPRACCFVY